MQRSLQSRLSAPRQFQSKCEGVSSNNLVRGKTRGLYRAGEVQGAEYPGSLARSRRLAFTRSSCNETCSHRAWRTTASWNAHYYCQSHAESESDAGRLCGLNAHAHPDFLDRLLLGANFRLLLVQNSCGRRPPLGRLGRWWWWLTGLVPPPWCLSPGRIGHFQPEALAERWHTARLEGSPRARAFLSI
jgi:hypothetical protein